MLRSGDKFCNKQHLCDQQIDHETGGLPFRTCEAGTVKEGQPEQHASHA